MKRGFRSRALIVLALLVALFGSSAHPAGAQVAPIGAAWAWGHNGEGELGDGTATNSAIPVRVVGFNGLIAIAAGETHCLALKIDGTVWAWGSNREGQLGNGTTTASPTPVRVRHLTGIVAVAARRYHSLALKIDGTVWAWGSNRGGQLGNGTTIASTTPVPVSGLTDVVAIAGGTGHSLAVRADGTVWAWGYNADGRLGNGTTMDSTTPVPVSGLTNVTAVAGAVYHSLALKTDGTVWAWGANPDGQLGDGTFSIGSIVPVPVTGLTDVVAIAGNGGHSLALKSDGTVWAWGFNGDGELGNGTTIRSATPVPVSGLTGVAVIAAGGLHSIAAVGVGKGVAVAWGYNFHGQLGNGTTADSATPVPVSGLTSVVAVVAGEYHSLALKSDGTVWAWGLNTNGELGNGTTADSATPVPVSGLTSVVAIVGGGHHSLALKSDGTVWAWGYNGSGQLGDGTNTNSATPVPVSGLTSVVGVAAGIDHSLALRADDTVWAWGSNGFGQLGQGTISSGSTTPVPVPNLAGVTTIAGGGWHSLALKTDGTVWAWGLNDIGQLGNGTKNTSTTPVPVNLTARVVAIAGGGWHSLALKADGTVWAWGYDGISPLVNGFPVPTTAPPTPPAQVSNLTDVAVIAGGLYHSLALKFDGTVWAWGQNGSGQLGNGTTNTSATPVPVSGLTNVGAIAAGGGNSLAIVKDRVVIHGPTNLDFGSQSVGTASAAQIVTLTNSGSAPVAIDNITIVDDDNDFSIQSNICGSSLAAGASCTISVIFNPMAGGQRYGTLIISDNAVNSPQQVRLTGFGIPAQVSEQCFRETGFCISGRIRTFWERNGGLPIFGFPITPQREELVEGRPLQVQWFERARLELHPENDPPYNVLLGRLGAERLNQQGRDWATFPPSNRQAGCRFFPQTGHNICGEILAAWHASGLEFDGRSGKSEAESLALFGLPLSDVQTETIEGREYLVQWFERGRFELHPENDPPYNVLLGLLGNEIRAGSGADATFRR